MEHCEECGLPLARCICEEIPCFYCGMLGCLGECREDEDDDIEELHLGEDET